MPMIEVGFGLGSNIGDKAAHVRRAAALLEERGLAQAVELSPLFRTAPWGPVEQESFVNACAVGRTALRPHALLAAIKALEVEIGRTVTVRWGPRVIDIDLLWYGDLVLDDPALVLPHRDMANRAFVLVPLATLRPELRLGGRRVADLAAAAQDGSVQLLGPGPVLDGPGSRS